MKTTIRGLFLATAGALGLAGPAAAATISVLGNDGAVYNVDVVTGIASFVTNIGDPPSTQPQFSPNALGVEAGSPTTITAMTFNTDGDESIIVNGTEENTFPTARDAAVAAGDSESGSYYYVDRDFGVYQVLANGAGDRNFLGDLGPDDTLGDLAIRGTTAYLSYGSSFSSFDLTDVDDGFEQTASASRFVGLGFAGDTLYGVSATSQLYMWNGTFDPDPFSYVADITLDGSTPLRGLTDASSAVPLPAAGWLLLGALGGLAAMRRRKTA